MRRAWMFNWGVDPIGRIEVMTLSGRWRGGIE